MRLENADFFSFSKLISDEKQKVSIKFVLAHLKFNNLMKLINILTNFKINEMLKFKILD